MADPADDTLIEGLALDVPRTLDDGSINPDWAYEIEEYALFLEDMVGNCMLVLSSNDLLDEVEGLSVQQSGDVTWH